LSNPRWVLVAFVIMSLWSIGGSMVLFLAALQGVPSELYEAAQIDGAGAYRRFLSVTLPMISPTVLFNAVTGFIATFQTFTTAFIMTRGGPENASLFYGLYLYRHAFSYFKMGYASALAWVLFLIVILLSLLLLRSSKSWVYYETGGGEL
jgi:multiple sugar transport system permease protein